MAAQLVNTDSTQEKLRIAVEDGRVTLQLYKYPQAANGTADTSGGGWEYGHKLTLPSSQLAAFQSAVAAVS
jgi:hypothetical protein